MKHKLGEPINTRCRLVIDLDDNLCNQRGISDLLLGKVYRSTQLSLHVNLARQLKNRIKRRSEQESRSLSI